ncbi:hypothetical protein AVEN_43721-1 [Araneus ventricosus]|uniref:Uncharacterized protein n=1 Tax=Araneus ventricosus TaxID=182803 RepID=A0A4Y2BZ56_ARAVE|nr:hypothetical protein AVEN_43721-1 [Araneus ventricosus]
MESSSTFKRISSANRDIEKMPAPLRSHISSPKSPSGVVGGVRSLLDDLNRTLLRYAFLTSVKIYILLSKLRRRRTKSLLGTVDLDTSLPMTATIKDLMWVDASVL